MLDPLGELMDDDHRCVWDMWPVYPLKDLGYDYDVVELTELLCGNVCPHPYDRIVAGSMG